MIFSRDELSAVVCNIRIPNQTLGNEEIGTGIFIVKQDEPFLVTAEHVVKKVTADSYIILSNTNGIPTVVLLSDIMPLGGFEFHGTADIAKASLSIPVKHNQLFQNRFFPYDQIDFEEDTLNKDIEVTTIGFPLGLGATGKKFSPLTYRTYPSALSITFPRFDNRAQCDFLILESPSIGGYSGGPVFDLGYINSAAMRMTKEKTILHGLVHGTITDPTGGKLAAITPSKYLKNWL